MGNLCCPASQAANSDYIRGGGKGVINIEELTVNKIARKNNDFNSPTYSEKDNDGELSKDVDLSRRNKSKISENRVENSRIIDELNQGFTG